jgi:hypothetical protein
MERRGGSERGSMDYRESGYRRRVIRHFRQRKLVGAGNDVLAAVVGVHSRNALPFQTTISGLAIRGAPSEAIIGSDQQGNSHETDRDVKTTAHLGLRVARGIPKPDLGLPTPGQVIGARMRTCKSNMPARFGARLALS